MYTEYLSTYLAYLATTTIWEAKNDEQVEKIGPSEFLDATDCKIMQR